jgi:hypothetical protein
MSIPEINLDLGATIQPFAPSSTDSARNKDKYHVDDNKDPTPCTLMYVKGRTSRTIEVAEAIVMSSHILHGRPVPVECAVVEVTTIREGCEFEDLDYPNEEKGIEKPVNAKGTFILSPPQRYYCQNLFIIDCFAMDHKGWGHSYFKHIDDYSKLSYISDSSCSRPSRPRAPGEHGEKVAFSSYSRPRALGEHGEKTAFSSCSKPRAPGQYGENVVFSSYSYPPGQHRASAGFSFGSYPRASGQHRA